MTETSKYRIQTEVSQIIENVNDGGTVIGKQVRNSTSVDAFTVMAEIFDGLHVLTQILETLQRQNPQVNEAEAQTIVKAEFIELKHNGKLATLRKQILNRERWFNGGKTALTEVAKHYVEGSVIYKAAIAFLEGFSEDEEGGE